MGRPLIVLKITALMFSALVVLANKVIVSLTGNLGFITPIPTLAALQAATTAVENAIAQWGTVHNRGSREDHADLVNKAAILHFMLTQEAAYCMTQVNPNDTPEAQAAFLLTSGFPVKNVPNPQGVLGPVENFRRFISPRVSPLDVKLKWSQPLNVTSRGNVNIYEVYRNTVNNFATATHLQSVPHGTYTDTPGIGTFFYWVVAVNNVGNGVTSGVVIAFIAPMT